MVSSGAVNKIASVALRLSFHIITANAVLTTTDNSTRLTIANDRLYASVNKSIGYIDRLRLDGQDLLGSANYVAPVPGGSTGSGNNGIGPYLDCYCVPSGTYTPGGIAPRFQLINGTDSTGTKYGGIVMGETYPKTGQVLEQYWFLREGETGLHTFSRLAYHNATTPFLRNLQEFRTLFRPNTPLWTHLTSTEEFIAPLPSANGTAVEVTVQDATWYLGNTPSDPYDQQMADYFTKYTFSETWRNQDVHGMFADGSTSTSGDTFGAWLVMNTVDTYFGGPTHSDLTVDGIVYNYISSNHHGDQTPNITNGFDRTFGPQYYHFNHGPKGASWTQLRKDAAQYASPTWNAKFYDSIAKYVPNYVPTSNRTTWRAEIDLPRGASNPIAVLSASGYDYQDNVFDVNAYQYWGEIDIHTGYVEIPMVKAGTYRLTVYADGIFGDYVQDDIVISAGKPAFTYAKWNEQSSGTELWRIGTPDKSSGEYKHGYERDPVHPIHPEQYRIYWAIYDFINDFPNGVVYRVGKDSVSKALNYVHWSVFGGYANSIRPTQYEGYGEINNWTILFDVDNHSLWGKDTATLTIQLAGAKTAAGNTDVYNASEPWSNLPLTPVINTHQLESWVIP